MAKASSKKVEKSEKSEKAVAVVEVSPTDIPGQLVIEVDNKAITEPVKGEVIADPAPAPTRPARTSLAWSDYVMSQFDKSELINGSPTTDGLRRVFEQEIGNIYSCHMTSVETPNNQNQYRATVHCEMKYADIEKDLILEVSDLADCFPGNTKTPYVLYATATAATMAESRCLRKGLRLTRVISAEEAMSADKETQEAYLQDHITNTESNKAQRNVILTLLNKTGIDGEKLFQLLVKEEKISPSVSLEAFDALSYKDAQTIVQILNKFHQKLEDGGVAVPDALLK